MLISAGEVVAMPPHDDVFCPYASCIVYGEISALEKPAGDVLFVAFL